MKEFWEAHKVKILSALAGIGAVVILVCGNVFCGRLPPPFAQLCVGTATEISNQLKQAGVVTDAGTIAPGVDANLPLCDDSLCLSFGPHLPMPDGGNCRCK